MNWFKTIDEKIKESRERSRKNAEERKLEAIKIKCPFCKDLVPANALRCSHCTADLSAKETQEKIKAEIKQYKQRQLGVGVGVILIFAIIVGFIIYAVQNSEPTTTTPPTPSSDMAPQQFQNAAKAMAEFMVKQDNKTGLRIWHKSLGSAPPDFASSETLYANIKRLSSDFALYRDKNEVLKLVRLLSDQNIIFDETILQILKENR